MNIDVLLKQKMKQAGWRHRNSYFYKRLRDWELVIELHNDHIFLDIYHRQTLTLRTRQKCKTFTEALAKSVVMEKRYSKET